LPSVNEKSLRVVALQQVSLHLGVMSALTWPFSCATHSW
jgi:hypothetical protein